MDLTREIDIYCERVSPELFAEPFNALSNIGFFVAAVLLLRHFGRRGWDFRTLAALTGLVGVGSVTFHTVATQWAAIADTLAIAIFIWFYLQRFLVHHARLGNYSASAFVMSYALTSRLAERAFPEDAWNGSVMYLPALVTLLAITTWVAMTKGRLCLPFLIASALFVLSLALRTMDESVCPIFPTGTHFLWHLLNACVLYALGAGLAGFTSRRRRRSSNPHY
ncbi:MAG: ceramidase domain-containing protein [Betaproteobacteria bacterium]